MTNGMDELLQHTGSDESLMKQAAGGSRAAFDALMQRYNPSLYRVALSVLRDEDDAQQAVEDAWVLAWKQLAAYTGQPPVEQWLARITMGVAQGRGRAA